MNKNTPEAETTKLLNDYSRSLRNDIYSRAPPGSTTWVPIPLTKTPSRPVETSRLIETPAIINSEATAHITVVYLKAAVFVAMIFIAFGSQYSEDSISTLKLVLKKNLEISNLQFGIIQSSSSLANSVLPILGGVFLSNFGVQYGCILASSFLALGVLLIAISSIFKELYLIVLGRIIFGFGTGLFTILRGSIMSQCFQGHSVAAASYLESFSSRLAALLAIVASYPLAELVGNYFAALWIPVLICLVPVIAHFGYALSNRTIGFNEPQESLTFRFSRLLSLPPQIWYVILIYSSLGAGSSALLHFLVDLVYLRFHTSLSKAGAFASISQILPLVLSPLSVYAYENIGGRLYLVVLSSLGFTFSVILLGFTSIHPILGMCVFSFSLLLGSASLSKILTTIVPNESLGTALGLYNSAFYISLGLQDLIIGKLQSQDPSSTLQDLHVYDTPMFLLVILGLVSTIVSILWVVLDFKLDESLSNSSKPERKKIQLARTQNPNLSIRTPSFYLRIRLGNQVAISLLLLANLCYFGFFYLTL